MTMEELNRKFGTSAVRFSAGKGALPLCTLETPVSRAEIYLHGAHVAAYEPTGERPVLYMSPRSNFAPGKPIRGGVPVCFPWFGPKADDPAAPAHGFARLKPWSVQDIVCRGDAITLSLQLDSDAETQAHWPFDFEAVLQVTLGDALKLQLEVLNRSGSPFEFTEALHTYFTVSDVRSVSVTGLEAARFVDKVGGVEQGPTGREIRFEGETNRAYLNTDDTCVIHDPSWLRKIEVAKSGSRSTVVWNPHVEKATALPDLGDDTWPNFVCVESANALTNTVTLAPGDVHIMSQTIRVMKG